MTYASPLCAFEYLKSCEVPKPVLRIVGKNIIKANVCCIFPPMNCSFEPWLLVKICFFTFFANSTYFLPHFEEKRENREGKGEEHKNIKIGLLPNADPQLTSGLAL